MNTPEEILKWLVIAMAGLAVLLLIMVMVGMYAEQHMKAVPRHPNPPPCQSGGISELQRAKIISDFEQQYENARKVWKWHENRPDCAELARQRKLDKAKQCCHCNEEKS